MINCFWDELAEDTLSLVLKPLALETVDTSHMKHLHFNRAQAFQIACAQANLREPWKEAL